MLMNTTFLGDSFSIKWQSRAETYHFAKIYSDFFLHVLHIIILEKHFKEKPHNRKQAIDPCAIPIKYNRKANSNAQKMQSILAIEFINPKQDQWKHIHSI